MNISKDMKQITKGIAVLLLSLATTGEIFSQDFIRVNQVGYMTNAPKFAQIGSLNAYRFDLKDAKTEEIVFKGSLPEGKRWNQSREVTQFADFSAFQTPGRYFVEVNGERSHPFVIGTNHIYKEFATWTIKAYYQWRASTPIESRYATFKGIDFAREMGHPDEEVFIHSSASGESRKTESVISSPKGWYDAGDYNKYVVNAGITLHQLFLAYEMFPNYFHNLDLNIPESENSLPDLLDEIKWETDWLFTMQDPTDGGVYHKLTTKKFCDISVQPVNDKQDRFVVEKSTSAALCFAAVMAMASRVFKAHDEPYANAALDAARKAWDWAEKNPERFYNNPSDIKTGTYGDNNFSDEFFWAASELLITTGEKKYYQKLDFFRQFETPRWNACNSLALMSMIWHLNELPDFVDTQLIHRKFFTLAELIYNRYKYSPGRLSLKFFIWGCNGEIATNGAILGLAYTISQDPKYRDAMSSQFDYLLGMNPTDYCFVSGFGTKFPKHLHDRRSFSDDIKEPLPGYLCGGANPNQTSDCGRNNYPSLAPARCYLDEDCSYSTNEIAINWNAPLVLLTTLIINSYE